GWYKTSSAMVTAMNNAAKSLANAVKQECPTASVTTMNMASQFSKAKTGELELITSEISSKDNSTKLGRHPTMAGAYLAAALLYNNITDRCVKDINVYGRLTEEEAKLLQEQAHILTGCTKETHTHYALPFTQVSGSKYTFASDSKLPALDKWNALRASILAYDLRGEWLQYDQRRINRLFGNTGYEFRHELTGSLSSPEDATPQHTLYTDCSNWITWAFYDTFGWSEFQVKDGCAKMYNSRNSIRNMSNVFTWTDEDINDGRPLSSADTDGNFVAYVNGSGSPAVSIKTKEDAKEYFISKLQPGDVIVYIHYPSTKSGAPDDTFAYQGGHVVLYMGNGTFMHCSGDQAGGGGSDYRIESKNDLYELFGGIQIDSMDILLDENAPRNVFDEAAVCILRPDYNSLTVTENAKARAENLVGIVSYKETTAPEGITVTAGDSVTFTFVVKNMTAFSREISITDIIPSALTYASGDGTLSGNKVSFSFSLAPFETKEVGYTVNVSKSAKGTVAMDNAYINGVRMNKTDVLVAKTLTEAQQKELASFIGGNSGSYKDAYSLACGAYDKLGISLSETYSTAEKALDAFFDADNSADTKYTYYGGAAKNMLVGNLYGGQNLKKASGYRAKDIRPCNLIAGDLLLFVAKQDAKAENTGFSKAQCYIYLGNGIVAGYDPSGKYFEVSGSEAIDLIDSLLGEGVFCVARPSITF
ncbi:MAG: DUF11 domain-containing protein, partial [Clostridia bacterium]|nr:DUF11 domain-containing protein [Clostridia bacterium]